MTLSSTILELIHEFTNPDNEIRSKAESAYNELISQRQFEVMISLLEIISADPSTNEAFKCLILIKHYLTIQKIAELVSTQIEFITNLKTAIISFCADDRFPKKANVFILNIIRDFFLIQLTSSFQTAFPFPEFFPIMIDLLNNQNFRSNALEILISPYFKESFQQHHQIILEKIDLQSADMEYRTRSFCFYANCIQFIEDNLQQYFEIIINQMPSIFTDMPNEYFHECIQFVYAYFSEKNFQSLSTLFPPLFILIIPRIINEEIDENVRANFVFDIICMLSSTTFFSFLCEEENQVQLIQALIVCSSNPILYPTLYAECRRCIKKLYKDYFFSLHNEIQYNLENFYQCTSHENLFVSSLFSRYLTDPSILQLGINFASVPDSTTNSNVIIRHNGLKQIRRSIKYNKLDDSEKMQLFEFLHQLYLASNDDKVIKVLSQWTRCATPELRVAVYPHIIELCEQNITPSLIACASFYCSDLDPENSAILSNKLFEATLEILKEDPYILTDLVFELYEISCAASVDSTLMFIEQIAPIILNIPEVFTKKYIDLMISNIIENIQSLQNAKEQDVTATLDQLGSAIFQKLMELVAELIEEALKKTLDEGGITNLCFAFDRIPYYSTFIEGFEQSNLSVVLKFINQALGAYDFRVGAYSLKCLKKLIEIYQQNEDLMSETIDIFNRTFSDCNRIYLYRILLKLFDEFINSTVVENFDAEKKINLIKIYPKLSEAVCNHIISITGRDEQISNDDMADIAFSIKQLITIMNSFFYLEKEETTKVIIEFLNFDLFSQNIPTFNHYLLSILTGLLSFGDFNQIQTIVINLIERIFGLITDPINKNNPELKADAIYQIASFAKDHEMPIEIINSFISNILAPILEKESVSLKIENRISDQCLAHQAISSFIIILSKYLANISDIPNVLTLLDESYILLTHLNTPTTQSLFILIRILLGNAATVELSQKLLKHFESLVQQKKIEPPGLLFLYQAMNQSQALGPFQPLFEHVVSLLQSLQNESSEQE